MAEEKKEKKPCTHEEVYTIIYADKIMGAGNEILVPSVKIICNKCKMIVRVYDKKELCLMSLNTYIEEVSEREGKEKVAELKEDSIPIPLEEPSKPKK